MDKETLNLLTILLLPLFSNILNSEREHLEIAAIGIVLK